MHQVKATWAESEDGSAPLGHGDSQEYHTANAALNAALEWAALMFSQHIIDKVVIFQDGSEIFTFITENEVNATLANLTNSEYWIL